MQLKSQKQNNNFLIRNLITQKRRKTFENENKLTNQNLRATYAANLSRSSDELISLKFILNLNLN